MTHNSEVTSDPWMNYMRSGDYEKAWEYSDNIIKSGINRDYNNIPRHFQCIWDGTSLENKRVLIRCYHGLGDTIQFIRYVQLVKNIASKVIVWSQPELIPLLETFNGIDLLIPLHDGIPEVPYDVDLEIMELPHVFRTTLATIPLAVPYFHVDPIYLHKEKNLLSAGIVWQAGDWNQSRNIPYSLIKPLTLISGVKFYILQANAEAAGWEEGYGIYPGEFNIFNYARVVCGLDLLITVDSMPAHLAGALNIPCWVLLHDDADWRWMKDRTDSLWYPSITLFRQKQKEHWEEVIDEVSLQLLRRVIY